MVEKMGHKKRMQMMRMEWINEGKPKPDNDDPFEEPTLPPRDSEGREKTVPIAPIFETAATGRPKTPEPNANGDVDMEDLYDATPRAARTQPAAGVGSLFGNAKIVAEDEPPEDDLDALLAEEEMLQATTGNAQPTAPVSKVAAVEATIDDDEEAAMAEMDMW
jgi:replication fork protection complex subunit Csm3/Swi3